MSNKTQVIMDMPFEEYLKIEALSSSKIKTINVSMSDYIEEQKKDNSDTPAKSLGRAYHKMILEGKEAFDAAYTTPLDKSDYLCTIADMKDFLSGMGVKASSKATKGDLEDAVRDNNGASFLFSDAIANETREFISQENYDRIHKYGDLIGSEFLGFQTEVTVLFDIDGVPCKARFDAVNRNGIRDLKTFSNPYKENLDTLPARTISRYRYDIQAVFYSQAYKAASLVRPDLFTKDIDPPFGLIWAQSAGGFNVMETILTPESNENYCVNGYWQKALDDIASAVVTYDMYLKDKNAFKFTIRRDWLEDHHLPGYHFDKDVSFGSDEITASD